MKKKLYCKKCKSHHHPADCPIEPMKDKKPHTCHIKRISFFDSFEYQCGCGHYYTKKDWVEQWDMLGRIIYRAIAKKPFVKWEFLKGEIKDKYRHLAYRADSIQRYFQKEG